MPEKNVVSWISMISGYSQNEQFSRALDMFLEMENERGVKPNRVTIASVLPACASLGALEHEETAPDYVTFVGVLLACTHGGLVMKGQELFESMTRNYNINPKLEHYGCMVDLLGRAGALQEAYDLIKTMPLKPDAVVWGALLGACSFHNNAELAEKAAQPLFELEPWNAGNYVILSIIYASSGPWDGVAKLRKIMKGGKITKAAGYSFLVEGDEMHKFLVEDKSHRRCDEIYEILHRVSMVMKLQEKLINFEYELLMIMEQEYFRQG
ncbi:Pentatricopeptide repeat-containing protein [Hibiscus syriacus]|uniref:Pentatricopeptide repeat-containing protein n=1 Tax=Hibiscus syriacus TaxID=106335 RepID=A0A6A3C3A5_HIBSY|nr:Pentatricopeptide repeat-containing protein [Hibiscus syriacus]